jgi:hypothetical protein
MRRVSGLVVVSLIAGLLWVVAGAPPAHATASEGTSGTAVGAEPAQIRYGQNLNVSASVADIDAFTGDCSFGSCLPFPNGRVDFYAVQNGVQSGLLTSGLLQDDKGELLQSSGTGAIPYCCLPVGTYKIRGYYVPGNYDPSSDDTDGTITVLPGNTSVNLSQSSQSTSLGQEVTFSVQVSPENLATVPASGFVDLRETVGNSTTTYKTTALDANGHATIKLSDLPGGSHSLFAVYGGDGNYNGSTSGAVTHSVSKGTVTNTLTASPSNTVFGQPITFVATVTPSAPATLTPTGQVDLAGSGFFQVRTMSNGSATWVVSQTPPGTHGFNSLYYGDNSYFGTFSNTLYVTVAKASTTTGLTSSQNPSTVGQPVTLTATVAAVAPGSGTPTGTVQFFDGPNALGAPAALSNGQASLTTSTLGGGTRTLTAVYSGDNNFNASTSPALSQTVTCDRIYTGSYASLTLGPGTSCISNATIGSALTIPSGAKVSIVNSTINGTLSTSGTPATLIVCGSTAKSTATISNVTGVLVFGDPGGGCALNTVSGSATVTSNHGGLKVIGNKLGSLTVNTNSGGPIVVGANTVSGGLACSGNNPAPVNGGQSNNVSGTRSGQCGAANF